MKYAALIGSALLMFATHPRAEVFKEDFSEGLDPRRWTISAWVAPHNSAKNKAEFRADHVKIVNGLLQLKLTQKRNLDGTFLSYGGEVKTVAKFGFGVYEFEVKASSTEADPSGTEGKAVSGSITGIASYLLHSETEIDIEYEGVPDRAHLTQTSTWTSEQAHEQRKVPIENIYAYLPHQRFQKYKWVWLPDKILFYRDGKLISTHAKVLPTKPAPMIFNHWGTHSPDWGGLGTADVTRYMYVKSFTFTPLDDMK